MDQGARDDGPDGAGVTSAARRSFLRGFSRDAARSAGTLMGTVNAITGAPAALGAELLGLRGGGDADAPEVAAPGPARPPTPWTPPPPPEGLRPWHEDEGRLQVLDQRALPAAHRELRGDPVAAAVSLIEGLAVPFGMVVAEVAARSVALGAREAAAKADPAARVRAVRWNLRLLRTARPTSGALAEALARLEAAVDGLPPDLPPEALRAAVETTADSIVADIGRASAALVAAGAGILAGTLGDLPGLLTVGTSGPLSGGGTGTAIGVIAEVARRRPGTRAWIMESRPTLAGARIGALELTRLGVPVTVVPDAAVAELARAGLVTAAIVPVEGVTAAGDLVAIAGTATLAAGLAMAGVPVVAAAPAFTTRRTVPAPEPGVTSPRPATEVVAPDGRRVAAPSADGWAPLVDVTAAALLAGRLDEDGARPFGPA